MSWKLWLDDQAFDPDCPLRWAPEGFFAATSSQIAIDHVLCSGLPDFVDFDHDLADGDNAMRFLRWLEYSWNAEGIAGIKPFGYRIHSANPVGTDNLVSFMESWGKIYTTS